MYPIQFLCIDRDLNLQQTYCSRWSFHPASKKIFIGCISLRERDLWLLFFHLEFIWTSSYTPRYCCIFDSLLMTQCRKYFRIDSWWFFTKFLDFLWVFSSPFKGSITQIYWAGFWMKNLLLTIIIGRDSLNFHFHSIFHRQVW